MSSSIRRLLRASSLRDLALLRERSLQQRRFVSAGGVRPSSRGAKLLVGAAAAATGGLAYLALRETPVVDAAVAFAPKSDEGEATISLSGRRDRFNFIADVVQLSAPAVVYIEIKDNRKVDYFTGQPATISNGSGFVVREDGLLLTNAHVVANAPRSSVQVRLHDGRTFVGRVEDIDMKSDLATVRIPVNGLPVMKLGHSAEIRAGEWVVALGSPLALSNTVTAGVVSSVDRGSHELGLAGKDMTYIQTDAAITFGNSGGPLVNLDGEAIGINSMKVTSGISFAIPIDYAKGFLSRAPGKSAVSTKKYIGITMLSITPEIFKVLRQKYPSMASSVTHGVYVWKVIPGSPAYGSGIYPGDIITHIDDTTINNANDVYKLLSTDNNSQYSVRIIRDNKTIEVFVRPDQFS